MTPRRLDCLIHTATATDNSEHRLVYQFLRRQEFQRRVDVSRHLVSRRCEILELSVLASPESAEVQRERIVSSAAQHHSEVVVDLAIRIALMKQQHTRPGFPG